MFTMITTSRITKYGKVRKIIEVPASVRDNFDIGDKVAFKKANTKKPSRTV